MYTAGLPGNTSYGDTGWAVTQLRLGSEIEAVCYHPEWDLYVASVVKPTPFRLPEDETHPEYATEKTSFLPQFGQSIVKLIDAKANIKDPVVDTLELGEREIVTALKTVSLEVSEKTPERKTLVAVGTSTVRGEDLPATGSVYILEIIPVVPEPERPETNRKFKVVAKSEVRGAVTALCGLGSHGLLLQAEGQKCMMRGLRDDGAFLPVAFIDMHCYVNVLKNLPGTGMCLMGDALKGVWFVGYEVSQPIPAGPSPEATQDQADSHTCNRQNPTA